MKGKIEIYKDCDGKWRSSIIAGNGKELMRSSEGYSRKIDCKKAIVKTGSIIDWAEIVEVK